MNFELVYCNIKRNDVIKAIYEPGFLTRPTFLVKVIFQQACQITESILWTVLNRKTDKRLHKIAKVAYVSKRLVLIE